MLLNEPPAIQLAALPLTVSDLLVGLESDDTREVIHQARILKHQADACAVPLLGAIAEQIAQTAQNAGLPAVQPLVLGLQQRLQQALQVTV